MDKNLCRSKELAFFGAWLRAAHFFIFSPENKNLEGNMQGQALVDYVKQVNDLEVAVYTNQRIQSHFDESFALRKPVPPIRPTLKSTAKPTRPTLKEIDNSKSGMCVVIALIILGIVCILFGIWAFSFTFIGGISILPAGIMLTYAGVKVLNKDEETKQNNKDALDI